MKTINKDTYIGEPIADDKMKAITKYFNKSIRKPKMDSKRRAMQSAQVLPQVKINSSTVYHK